MITAVVVARGGSVRLPGKALLPFGDTTLIGWKIRQLVACAEIDRVVVNSDSPAIVKAAVREGAAAMAGRDYKGDTHAMIADTAQKAGGEVIVWAHPTNPLVSSDTYDAAVRAYYEALEEGRDSLCSVYAVRRHAWMKGKPLNYDPWTHPHPLAKDTEPVMFQDGAIFIQSRRQFIETRYFFGDNPVLFVIPPSEVCDIDTSADYADAVRRHAATSAADASGRSQARTA